MSDIKNNPQTLTLVTGGTGLVGFNVIKALLSRGRKVRALVRSPEKGARLLPEGVDIVSGDVTDKASVLRAMQGCSVVYHIAGYPEQWKKSPSIFDQVNVGGTQNMIDAALALGVDRFIYTSTIDVFKAGKGETFDESIIDTTPKWTFYERSKQEADRHVVAALEKGLPALFIHPAAVYGPGPSDSPGINELICKLYKNQVPALLPGGFPVVYSVDVGEGHVAAEEKAAIGERFILSESYQSLDRLAGEILTTLGLNKSTPFVLPYPLAKVASVMTEAVADVINKPPLIPKGQLHFLQWQAIPSSKKAQAQLAWQPTPVSQGLKKTVEFLFS